MEFHRKIFLIFILALISCSRTNFIETSEKLQVNLNRIDIWLDLMPKIDSPSLIHLETELSLRNLSNKNIQIDSISFQVDVNENIQLSFYDKRKSEFTLASSASVELKYKLSQPSLKELLNYRNKNSKIFLNLYFKETDISFYKRISLGEKEIQTVY